MKLIILFILAFNFVFAQNPIIKDNHKNGLANYNPANDFLKEDSVKSKFKLKPAIKLDVEYFNMRYYTVISQNSFRTDGVYYTFDSTEVYETTFLSSMPYREKSFMDSNYPNSEYVNFDTSFKSYFISLVWFTENGKVFFSKHGQFDEGASPGVEVVRREVDVDSLKYHLLNEKLDYIEKNTFTDNDIRGYYSSKGFYRVNNNDIIIKYRSRTQHGERHYENELEAKLVNDTTINYYINLSPITGYHDFIFYKTDIQPSEYFMRLTK